MHAQQKNCEVTLEGEKWELRKKERKKERKKDEKGKYVI